MTLDAGNYVFICNIPGTTRRGCTQLHRYPERLRADALRLGILGTHGADVPSDVVRFDDATVTLGSTSSWVRCL